MTNLLQFIFLFLNVSLFACLYDWDDNYPKIDPSTGYPIYTTVPGDTMVSIILQEYGNEQYIYMVYIHNAHRFRNFPGISQELYPGTDIALPPADKCLEITSMCPELPIETTQQTRTQLDGGSTDKFIGTGNRRILQEENAMGSSTINYLRADFNKDAFKYWNVLKTTLATRTGMALTVTNESPFRFRDWQVKCLLGKIEALPIDLKPGASYTFMFTKQDKELSCSLRSRVRGLPGWLRIRFYISGVPTGNNLLGINILSDSELFSELDGYGLLGPYVKSWEAGWVSTTFNRSYYGLITKSFISGANLATSTINITQSRSFFPDPQRIYHIAIPGPTYTKALGKAHPLVNDIWVTNFSFQDPLQAFSFQLMSDVDEQYIIMNIQDKYYLSLTNGDLLLRNSQGGTREPEDEELWRFRLCTIDGAIRYEIYQGDLVLSPPPITTSQKWRLIRSSEICQRERLLDIVRNIFLQGLYG